MNEEQIRDGSQAEKNLTEKPQSSIHTESITDSNLSAYLSMLENDEIFGIRNGVFAAFGAFANDRDKPLGVLVVRIYPEYIRVEKLLSTDRNAMQEVATALLSIVKQQPEDGALPIYFFVTGGENMRFLTAKRVIPMPESYTLLKARIGDMDKTLKPHAPTGYELCNIEQVSEKALTGYIMSSDHDNFVQFPELKVDPERFCPASPVCMRNGVIEAVILIEEKNEEILIPYFHGKDENALRYAFFALKGMLLTEYEPTDKIRILLYDDAACRLATGLFTEYKEQPMQIFKLR